MCSRSLWLSDWLDSVNISALFCFCCGRGPGSLSLSICASLYIKTPHCLKHPLFWMCYLYPIPSIDCIVLVLSHFLSSFCVWSLYRWTRFEYLFARQPLVIAIALSSIDAFLVDTLLRTDGRIEFSDGTDPKHPMWISQNTTRGTTQQRHTTCCELEVLIVW